MVGRQITMDGVRWRISPPELSILHVGGSAFHSGQDVGHRTSVYGGYGRNPLALPYA